MYKQFFLILTVSCIFLLISISNLTACDEDPVKKLFSEFNPDSPRQLFEIGRHYFDGLDDFPKDQDRAIDWFTKAININEDTEYWWPKHFRGCSKYNKAKMIGFDTDQGKELLWSAIDDFAECFENFNKEKTGCGGREPNFGTHYWMGQTFLALKKLPLALYAASEGIRESGDVGRLQAKAEVYWAAGKYDEAKTYYERMFTQGWGVATDRQKEHIPAHIGLARYNALKGKFKEAFEHLDTALTLGQIDQLGIEHLDVYLERGALRLKKDEREAATADYELCLKIDPNDQSAKMALQQLK